MKEKVIFRSKDKNYKNVLKELHFLFLKPQISRKTKKQKNYSL